MPTGCEKDHRSKSVNVEVEIEKVEDRRLRDATCNGRRHLLRNPTRQERLIGFSVMLLHQPWGLVGGIRRGAKWFSSFFITNTKAGCEVEGGASET